MDGEILDAVTEWGTRPVADGVSGLYELADGSFSGAVTDGSAWAFVLNGRFVGVFDGDIDDFEDASLTAYTAPDLSLPLLYAMQARGGDVRGQYYSNDTPLSEIDDTLSSGSFVGYVELSENVLSGDYYVVYYGGRSLPVAFVGNNQRLLTGDEAFERAADEVGIYSVVDADIEVVELPERPEPDTTDDTAVAVATDVDGDGESAATGTESESEPASVTIDDEAHAEAESGANGESDATATSDESTETAAPADAEFSELDMTGEPAAADTEAACGTDVAAEAPAPSKEAGDTSDEPPAMDASDPTAPADADDTDAGVGDESPDADAADATPGDDAEAAAPEDDTEAADPDELARLRAELDAAREAKADLEAERDDYREEAERLRDRVASLEAEIDRLDAAAADTDEPSASTLTPDEALSGTNLFVRYEDKAEGTLERAAEGRISETELRDNLRLDYHTEFETDGVRVDGQSFDAFLRATPEHRFSMWMLSSLTYDIRRTDTRAELSKLYEAIEAIDRIDLDGEIDVTVEGAEGETESTAVTFDVVFRNKMGDPLFVASFDDSRDPTRAETIQSLLDGAESVSNAVPSFAAAFVVTTSYFDADAMEVAVDATRGGLFSRSSRKSYVKLSRKSGFHLCLVEARDEDFFLSVPEL